MYAAGFVEGAGASSRFCSLGVSAMAIAGVCDAFGEAMFMRLFGAAILVAVAFWITAIIVCGVLGFLGFLIHDIFLLLPDPVYPPDVAHILLEN